MADPAMQIRFISTLTRDDEDRLAEALFETVKGLLATFPIGYLLQIETADHRVFHDSRVAAAATIGLSSEDFSREKAADGR
jgi:hypothetical protein